MNNNGSTSLYRHFDGAGTLLYVGVSLSALHRLSQHRNHSHWFSKIKTVTIEHFSSREMAIEAETNAIRDERPLYNLLGNENKKTYVVDNLENSRENIAHQIVALKPIYKPDEIAEMLGISRGLIKQQIESKQISALWMPYKGGQKCLITGWQFLEYLEFLQSNKGVLEVGDAA